MDGAKYRAILVFKKTKTVLGWKISETGVEGDLPAGQQH